MYLEHKDFRLDCLNLIGIGCQHVFSKIILFYSKTGHAMMFCFHLKWAIGLLNLFWKEENGNSGIGQENPSGDKASLSRTKSTREEENGDLFKGEINELAS